MSENSKELIKSLSEPVTKLIDAISQAIGKAYEPRYVRRMADAKAYEISKISEEIRNNSDLPIVYNGDTSVDISEFDSIIKRTGARLAYQEIRRQENIEAIIDISLDDLKNKSSQSEEQVSQDWMTRYITNAGDVSSEEMQLFWAKLLSCEILTPRSFSLKTLDCVRNLTASDARLFSKISSFIINDSFLLSDKEYLNLCGINYDDLLRLDECGLLNSDGLIHVKFQANKEPRLLFDLSDYIVLCKSSSDNEQNLRIGQFPLTQAGKELIKITRTSTISEDCAFFIVDVLKRITNNCFFTLHKVNSRIGDTISYEPKEVSRESSV